MTEAMVQSVSDSIEYIVYSNTITTLKYKEYSKIQYKSSTREGTYTSPVPSVLANKSYTPLPQATITITS